jgi:hypothetical protein
MGWNMDKKQLTGNSSSGEIVLGFGQHEVNIQMDSTPCKVSLSMRTPCASTPVCHGDINKIGVTILENGFVLYADIRTNSCCVEWVCDV